MHIQGAGLAHKVKPQISPSSSSRGTTRLLLESRMRSSSYSLRVRSQMPSALGDLMVIQVDDQIPAGEPVLPVFRRLTPQRRPHRAASSSRPKGLVI